MALSNPYSSIRANNLKRIRSLQYPKTSDALKAISESGVSISEYQYLQLEKGGMPNSDQLYAICNFFEITPNDWLWEIKPNWHKKPIP